jgi:hypothetical protein
MADSNPLAIAKSFAGLAAAVTGVRSAYHYVPENMGDLPSVTMLLGRPEQSDRFTGPSTENTWRWRVFVTVAFGGNIAGSDMKASQEALMNVLPPVMAIARQNPTLGLPNVVLRSGLSPADDAPDFDEGERWMGMAFELFAVTEEV